MSRISKILITGGSGMVGRNIIELIRSDYDLLTPSSVELNLLSQIEVDEFFLKNKPDLVIHCAGKVGGIQANIKNPVSFLYENMIMGYNVVMSSRKSGVKNLINLGSSCMYPKDYKNPLKEDYILQAPLEPTNEGYALAKISTAKLCEYIFKEDNNYHYKTLLPCNLYGYFDKFSPDNSHMIPAVIRKIHEAKENNSKAVEIWGDGTARREFMFSGDLANFIKDHIQKVDVLPNMLNIGIGFDYSILEYYRVISNVIGYEGDFIFNTSKPVGMKQKMVDVSRLKKLFNYEAETSLKVGIDLTYKYFLKNEV
jgi:GDP-L-fucose synthase